MRIRRMVFGMLTVVLALVILVAIFTNRTSQLTDIVSEDFLVSQPSIQIEKVNGTEHTTLDISKSSQQEILSLLTQLNIRKTDTTYRLSEADYRITSKTNRDFELYLFLDENILVINDHKKGYLVTDETFMERVEALIQ
ncbi:hypothetical protein [Ureibacillus manganicus]|uniref:Uncharacterized protein n=1 Tax=Ureibacillus manganicus DSM 26584 TaxID=1384049 RepID=A0A0A3I3V4_9BACL|nr:hypothetical protein [Ureibacillus manganicus]KGR79394.1 hypothetical protein CD29_06790 [Ureibacillus manganicus DSM 26584]